jgi:hypothetical protein
MNREWIGKAGIQSLVKDLVAENSVSSLSNVSASQKVADWLESIGFEIELTPMLFRSMTGTPVLMALSKPSKETADSTAEEPAI